MQLTIMSEQHITYKLIETGQQQSSDYYTHTITWYVKKPINNKPVSTSGWFAIRFLNDIDSFNEKEDNQTLAIKLLNNDICKDERNVELIKRILNNEFELVTVEKNIPKISSVYRVIPLGVVGPLNNEKDNV